MKSILDRINVAGLGILDPSGKEVIATRSAYGSATDVSAVAAAIVGAGKFDDVLEGRYRMNPLDGSRCFEWGDAACIVASTRIKRVAHDESWSTDRPGLVFLPAWNRDGRYVAPPAAPCVQINEDGYCEPTGRLYRLDDVDLRPYAEEDADAARVDVSIPGPAVDCMWLTAVTLSLLADGIAVRDKMPQPERWRKAYRKRNGRDATERWEIRLVQPSYQNEGDRHVCLHYTRPHYKFFSGEPGHRFFGSSEPRTLQTPGFWSGNLALGIGVVPS